MTEIEIVGPFSVWQFFEDGNSERVRFMVGRDAAMTAFNHYTNNVTAGCGITRRVIVTSGGCINLEWQYGKGITFI